MATLVEKLTAEGSGEPAGFLNDLVEHLWPNICVAGRDMIKSTVEPMFKTMLPGPLSSLHFTKIDLGHVPIQFSNVKVSKTDGGGIELDMNVDWAGKCDIELDADMIPGLGVESVQLHGRLTVLLCPLTNVIPLIGAAQVSFINEPVLHLDFTGAANVADFSAIDGVVRQTILNVINSMLTLPNRYLVKLDSKNDWFQTYPYPLGIIRITVEQAWGFAEESKGTAKKLLSKITRADPDCYAKVSVGAVEPWRTSTKNNKTSPSWNETHDFVVSDFEQCIKVDVQDHDLNGDDDIGLGVTTVREIMLAGGKEELVLTTDGKETEGRVSVSAKYFGFKPDTNSFTASEHNGEGLKSGIATILVASAFGIKGRRDEITPSVVVTCGEQRFQTAVKADSPGSDINNPTWDQFFNIPLTASSLGKSDKIRLALMNGQKEVGGVEVPFNNVLKAENGTLQDDFKLGDGSTVRASIRLRGIAPEKMHEAKPLPERKK